jgi:4-amino-4-deoxy-L-arabinose transferase-like glycosyltransferase
MIFNSTQTSIGLLVTSLPAILSLYLFFFRGERKASLILLMLSAFSLRLLMISLDPFVQEWDERFHALVAKHMMDYPFKPMLILNPILAQSPYDWGSLHIWVHKQPLFLWQMAISMKIFGVTPFAMRLPSAMMGCIMVWLIYDIARKWISNETIAYIAAFIASFSFYSLELTSGRLSLEHNDLAFTFYVTCSLWAFTRYVQTGGGGICTTHWNFFRVRHSQ